MVEKTQERQVYHAPQPSRHEPTSVQRPGQHHSSSIQSPPRQRSSRRSRSKHQDSPASRQDKRPVSIHRRPRSRRPRHSSRTRSFSRSPTRPRHRSPPRHRERSITLKSASPRRHAERPPAEDFQQSFDQTSKPPILQASSWWSNQQYTWHNDPKDDSYHQDQSTSHKWKSWGKWKNYSNNPPSTNQYAWEDYQQSSNRHATASYDSTSKPLTAFSSSVTAPPRHKQRQRATSGDDKSQISVNVPTGHMLINLRADHKAEWKRAVKFGLHHNQRMKAASEIPYDEQPQPSRTVNIEFQRAVTTLQRVDSRIPEEVAKKAVFLISSTNLLSSFELEQASILD